VRALAVALAWLGLVAAPGDAEACFCASACTPKTESTVFEATVTAIGPSADPWLHGQVVMSLADVVVVQGAAPRAVPAMLDWWWLGGGCRD
jgi:hypothetical protein